MFKQDWIEDQYLEIEEDLCIRINRICKKTEKNYAKKILKQAKEDADILCILENHLNLTSVENAVLSGNKELFERILIDEYNDTIGEAQYDAFYNDNIPDYDEFYG
jgi:hypothetical protein